MGRLQVERSQLRLSSLNRVMRDQAFQADVNRRMAKVAAAAGPKFRLVVRPHRFTARAYVEAADGERLTDADVSRLLKGLEAARN